MTLVAAFIGPASAPFGIPDGLWSLLRGRWMAEHGTLLDADPFTSAPHVDGPMLNVQWLADLVLFAANQLGGLPLVIVSVALAVTATAALMLLAAYSASPHLRLSCVAVWASYILGATNFSPRPQTLAYPLFAAFVLAVARAEWHRDTRVLWVLPRHGALGEYPRLVLPGLRAARVCRRRSRHRHAPASLRASVRGDTGRVCAGEPGQPVRAGRARCTSRASAATPSFATTSPSGRRRLSTSPKASCFSRRSGPRRADAAARIRLTPVELVCLLAFGYLAWSSVRVVVWWGIVLAPIVARLLGASFPSYRPKGRDRPLVNVLVLGLALVDRRAEPAVDEVHAADPASAEAGAVQRRGAGGAWASTSRRTIRRPAARMLNHQGWGGYLEWALWPRHTVFLDGRIELHPIDVWLDYVDLVLPSAGWQALFDGTTSAMSCSARPKTPS